MRVLSKAEHRALPVKAQTMDQIDEQRVNRACRAIQPRRSAASTSRTRVRLIWGSACASTGRRVGRGKPLFYRRLNPTCEISIPANISPHPTSPRKGMSSFSKSHPPNAAKTVSRLRMMAAWLGAARR